MIAEFRPLRLSGDVDRCAGAFGANNIPKCLRAVTILGMQQARQWGLGSLNEFRKFFGLKTYDTFEEINPDEVEMRKPGWIRNVLIVG